MKIFQRVALVAATVALIATTQAGAAGPTNVSNVYTVDGLAIPGVDTGLVLRQGQVVTVTATGGVCPYGDSYCPGPDGNAAVDTTDSSYGGFPLPGAPAWGLVGRVGSGAWVQVGQGPTALSGTGALVLAVNDDLVADNAGSFTVTVSYACWPGWGYGDKNHTHCGPPGLVSKTATSVGTEGDACRPGWGNGDENHAHCGPPGLVSKNEPSADERGNGNRNGNGSGSSDPGQSAEDGQGHGKPDKGKG
jgi:hypothetical protein